MCRRARCAASGRHRPVQIRRVQTQRIHQGRKKPGLLEAGPALSRRHRIHDHARTRAAQPRLLCRAVRHDPAERDHPDAEGFQGAGAASDLRSLARQCAAHDADQPGRSALRQSGVAPGDGSGLRPQGLSRHHQRGERGDRRQHDAAAERRLGHAARGVADPARLRSRCRQEPRRGAQDHGEARLRAGQAPRDQGVDPQLSRLARLGGDHDFAFEGNLYRRRTGSRRYRALVPARWRARTTPSVRCR